MVTTLKHLLQKITPSQKTAQNAKSPGTNSSNETHNSESSKTTTNEEIPNTPFRLIHLPEHGYFITMGQHRISQMHKTKTQALQQLDKYDWQLICNLIISLFEEVTTIKNQQNQTK